MNEWFNLSELAGLSGLPAKVSGVRRRADREQWQSQPRQGRGGGKEYHIDSLPPETRAHLLSQTADQEITPVMQRQLVTELPGNPPIEAPYSEPETTDQVAAKPKKQRQIEAWLEILKQRQTWCENQGIDQVVPCDIAYSEAYNQGEIQVPDWVRETVDSFSRSTIANKRRDLKKGINELAPKHQGSKKKLHLTPEIKQMIEAMIFEYPHAGPTKIYRALQAKDLPFPLPSERTIARYVKHWKQSNKQVFAAITSPDQFKGKYMAAMGSKSEEISRLNQCWEFDSTPADVMLNDGRYSLIGAIDVYSRRAKLLVSKTSRGSAIIALLRRCIIDWGVPEIAKTDNGKDYTSNYIKRVLEDLGIYHKLCPPFQPWHKPFIERFFGTFSHDIIELLDNYVGHNVAERQKIRDRKAFSERLQVKKKNQGKTVELDMTAAQLQELCDIWCNNYMHRQHSGIEMTPFEMVTNWTQPIKTLSNHRTLDILLAQSKDRVVAKKGISLENTWFIAPELALVVGEPVLVRFDPSDMGRIYVFHEGKYLCTAEAPERTGIDRQSVAAEGKRRQRQTIQAQKQALKKAAKNLDLGGIAEEMVAAETRKNQGLVAMPKHTVEHETEEILRTARAIDRAEKQSQLSEEEREAWRVKLEQEEADRQRRKAMIIDTDAIVEKVFLAWKEGNTETLTSEDLVVAKRCAPLPDGKGIILVYRENQFQERQFFWWLEEQNPEQHATG